MGKRIAFPDQSGACSRRIQRPRSRVTGNKAKNDYILKLHPAATARLDAVDEKQERLTHTWGPQKEKCGILVDDKLSSFQNGRYRAHETCGGNVSFPLLRRVDGTRIPASRVINQKEKKASGLFVH